MRTSNAYRPTRRFHGVGRKMLITSLEGRIIVDHCGGPTNLPDWHPASKPPGHRLSYGPRLSVSHLLGSLPQPRIGIFQKNAIKLRWTTTPPITLRSAGRIS